MEIYLMLLFFVFVSFFYNTIAMIRTIIYYFLLTVY